MLKAEADAQAAWWAVLARTGPDWIDGYASAVEWRDGHDVKTHLRQAEEAPITQWWLRHQGWNRG